MPEPGFGRLRHDQLDLLHTAMVAVAGAEPWGDARDRLAALEKSQSYLSACETVLLGADLLDDANAMMPQSLRLLLAAAAWVWIKNVNHSPMEA
jgi:hypothetical protein